MMRPPSLLYMSTAFLLCGGCLSQPVEPGTKFLPTLTRSPVFVAGDPNNGRSGELKLSPVPQEAEAGLPSPPVPEPLGIEYEVHEAPAAPHNFILQPVARPGGAHPSNTYQKPQVYGTNNHYFINQQEPTNITSSKTSAAVQIVGTDHTRVPIVHKYNEIQSWQYNPTKGNLAQRPQHGIGQMNTRPPLLNFNESPPSFPHLTDEELYMLGQPVPLHQVHQGNETSIPEGEEPEASISILPGVILTETDGSTASIMSQSSSLSEQLSGQAVLNQSPMIPNQPPTKPIYPSSLPNQPSTLPSASLPLSNQPFTSQKQPILPAIQPPTSTSQPSITMNRPAGVYIATVSYGPANPSLVYTCVPTEHLKPSHGGYVQGLFGYSCNMSKGRPSLASQILTANNQKPVSQPVVSMEPVSLPIVTPIKFMDIVE